MMKTIYISLLILAIGGPIAAQSPGSTLSKKEQRQLLKEERKKQEAIEAAKTAKLVEYMVSQQRFILEANVIYDKYGHNNFVSPTINFIAVDSLLGVIQIGNADYIGSNGLGGVTIEGKISGYEWSLNKKGENYILNYTVRSVAGRYEVSINIHRSGKADATVHGTFGGSISYSGQIVHPAKTRVFKGTSIY